MDKVLIEALKTMKELPDVKGSEVLKITRMGIVKRHNGYVPTGGFTKESKYEADR